MSRSVEIDTWRGYSDIHNRDRIIQHWEEFADRYQNGQWAVGSETKVGGGWVWHGAGAVEKVPRDLLSCGVQRRINRWEMDSDFLGVCALLKCRLINSRLGYKKTRTVGKGFWFFGMYALFVQILRLHLNRST